MAVLGNDTLGSEREESKNFSIYLQRVTATEDGTLTQIEGWLNIYDTLTGEFVFCVYADTAGQPTTYLEKSDVQLIPGNSAMTHYSAALQNSIDFVSGDSYWVGIQVNGVIGELAWNYDDGYVLSYNSFSPSSFNNFINPFTPDPNTAVESGYRYCFSGVYSTGGGSDETLQPPLLNQTSTIFTPVVTPDAITLSPSLLSQVATIFAPVVVVGALTLSPPVVTKTATLFSPTVTTGAITVAPPLVTNTATIYAPTVSQAGSTITLNLPLLTRGATIYSPMLIQTQILQPPQVQTGKVIYTPTITTGAITLSPGLLNRTASILAPRVDSGTRYITIENRIANSTSGRTTSTGGIGWFTRTMHIIGGGNVKDVFSILDGWSKGAGSIESNLANAFNITKMTFEIVGEPVVPVTFGGSRSFTVQPGALNVESDFVSAATMKSTLSLLPIGTEFWVKTIGTMGGVGATFVLPTNVRVASDVPGTQFGWYNPANTTIVNDPDVAGVFTWTGTAPEQLTSGWSPMIGGHFEDDTHPVVMAFDGDSHTQGLQDAVASKYGRGTPQYILKGDGSNSPITGLRSGVNLGVSGDSSSTRLSSPKLIAKAKYATDVYTHIGSNDLGLGGGGNVTTLHNNRMEMLSRMKAAVTSVWKRTPKAMVIEYQPAAGLTNPTKTINSAPNTNWGVGGKSWQLTLLGQADSNIDYFVMTPSFRQSLDSTQVEYFLWKYNPASVGNVYDTLMTPDGQHAGNAGVLLWAGDINPTYRQIGVTGTLSPPVVTQTPSVFSPVVAQGDSTLQVPLLTQSSNIFAPVVTLDAITLQPPSLSQTASIFTPTVTAGAITITAPLVIQGSVIFAPLVDVGGLIIQAPLLNNVATLFAPTVTTGPITLQPGLIDQTSIIFSPIVSIDTDLQVPLLTSTQVVYSPVVTQFAAGEITLEPPLVVRSRVIFAPAIATGSIAIRVEVYSGAVSAEIPGYVITDSVLVKTSVTSLGTTSEGLYISNTLGAGVSISFPDNQP